jgi:hypothetical protein
LFGCFLIGVISAIDFLLYSLDVFFELEIFLVDVVRPLGGILIAFLVRVIGSLEEIPFLFFFGFFLFGSFLFCFILFSFYLFLCLFFFTLIGFYLFGFFLTFWLSELTSVSVVSSEPSSGLPDSTKSSMPRPRSLVDSSTWVFSCSAILFLLPSL